MRTRLLVPFYPMPPAVQARIRSARAAWADRAATAYVAEGVAVDGVATDPSVLDTETETLYGDGVECRTETLDGLSGGRKSALHNVTPPAEPAARWTELARPIIERGFQRDCARLAAEQREVERQAFLRRVQYVDPRERRA